MALSPHDRRTIAWRAAGIYERIAHAGADAVAASDDARRRAGADVDVWCQTFAPGNPDAFERRLAWDGLTRDRVIRAAAAAPPPSDGYAEWTDWLDRFADPAREIASELRAGHPVELSRHGDAEEIVVPFEEFWLPVVRAAGADLDARIGMFPRLRADVRRTFDLQLARELSAHGELALDEQFTEYATAHGASRADIHPHGDALYRGFTLHLLDDGGAAFWSAYPVLARHAVIIARQWIAAVADFVARVARDRAAIAAALNDGIDPGAIVRVEPSLSDPHEGRRRVMAVTFESGLCAIYKPRDVTIERAYAEFAGWLRRSGFAVPLAAARTIARDGYGWMEAVEQDAFASRDAVRDYFRSAGALVFFAHLLGGKDLHMENLVATRRGPVLIDAEMLLQPAHGGVVLATLDRSCLRTGLVSIVEFGGDDEPYDIGGLRGGAAMPVSIARREWRHARSDAIAFREIVAVQPSVANAVVLDGVTQTADEYADDIADGFARAYAFAREHAGQLRAAGGPLDGFRTGYVRVIARPTNQYAMLHAIRATPRYQRDGALASMGVDILVRPLAGAPERPAEWPFLVEERRIIEALDVPRFVVPGASGSVYANGRVVLANYYAESPIDAALARLDALSPDDCTVQMRQLRRALQDSIDTRFFAEYGARDDVLLAHAEWIGRELLAHPQDARSDRASAHDLYDGSLGPALFFSALAATTGDRVWTDAAERALAPARHRAESGDAGDAQIGGCCGLGSIACGLTLAGALLGDDRALAAARRVALLIDDARIAADADYDVTDGAAGALLGILAVHACAPDAALVDRAAACARHLIAARADTAAGAAWPSSDGRHLVGFAHGAAGIAAALARFAAVSGSRRAQATAADALAFVSSAYAPGDRSWPIATAAPASRGVVGRMNAWCHGAPGIALAATAALDISGGDAILTQARSALTSIGRWGIGQGDHLCCGHVGRVDVLLTAGARLGMPETRDAARTLADRVLARARARRHFRLSTAGFEYRVHDGGFFRGLSGIGYVLLRLAAPDRLPSVLAFEPPKASS